ncbi:hypothetical protein BH23VER1_BH23VER1_29710 [soil metagenome]
MGMGVALFRVGILHQVWESGRTVGPRLGMLRSRQARSMQRVNVAESVSLTGAEGQNGVAESRMPRYEFTMEKAPRAWSFLNALWSR